MIVSPRLHYLCTMMCILYKYRKIAIAYLCCLIAARAIAASEQQTTMFLHRAMFGASWGRPFVIPACYVPNACNHKLYSILTGIQYVEECVLVQNV